MSRRTKIWLWPALLYAAFFFWYTDLGGALSDAEVDLYVSTMKLNDSQPETIALIEQFARADSGRQFLMVNNIDLSENPPNVEGARSGETANELMGRYGEHIFPALLSRACHPVLTGSVVHTAIDLLGIEGGENWDQAAVFRYRSRRDLLDIITAQNFRSKHHFKTAALEKTIAYPIETGLYLSDLRWLFGLILLTITAF